MTMIVPEGSISEEDVRKWGDGSLIRVDALMGFSVFNYDGHYNDKPQKFSEPICRYCGTNPNGSTCKQCGAVQ